MRLPDKWDYTIKPTVRCEWFPLMPKRSRSYWWRVGYVVRLNRVRHMNLEKVREVCLLVEQMNNQKQEYVSWALQQQVSFVLR